MKVLHLVPASDSSHGFVFAKRQIEDLTELGVDCRSIFLHPRQGLLKTVSSLMKARRTIREFRPDVVHVHYGSLFGMLALALAWGTRRVLSIKGNDIHLIPFGWRSRLAHVVTQLSLPACAAIIPVNRAMVEQLWWCRSRCTVLADGVNLEDFQPGDRLASRRHLGLDPEAPLVLVYRSSSPLLKGYALAQQTLTLASAELESLQSVVLDGSTSPQQMPHYLNACDALLFCSVVEGSPNLVREALACNLPVISVDVGDVAERVRGVEPGYLAPRRDPRLLAERLVEVLRSRRRSNGRVKAEETSRPNVARRLIEIYKSAMEAA